MTLGPMEATAETIAQTNRELSGYAQTRTTLPGSIGDVIIAVESTLDWPESGTVVIFGTLYTYAAKTLTTLEGLAWTDGATVFPGLRVDTRIETIVTDYSRASSAMDLLRRAVLVNYAEGADLSTVGRNLGVNRLPLLADDDRFRELIKVIAYGPRGTVYILELAMTALVGAGNFEIFEDRINFPKRVFIRLIGSALTSDMSEGKVYLWDGELVQSDSTSQVTVAGSVISRGAVSRVQLKDEDHLSDFRLAYPSVETLVEYPGDPGTLLWGFLGTGVSEGVHVTQISGVLNCIEFTVVPPTNFAIYIHPMRATYSSKMIHETLVTVPTGAPNNASFGSWACSLDDGSSYYAACINTPGASTFTVQFADPSTGTAIAGSTGIVLNRDQFYTVRVEKEGAGDVALYVDGVLVDRLPQAGFPATTSSVGCGFGAAAVIGTHQMRIKQSAYWSRTLDDFWGVGEANGTTSNPDILTAVGTPFVAGDVGRKIRTSHPTSVINNGDWEIYQFDSTSQVRVVGSWWPGTAELGVGAVDRVTVNQSNPQLFTYPDDIGKSIEIQNSVAGNDGVYVIAGLLEPGTLTDYSTYDTPVIERTNIAVITGALTPESGAEWRLVPSFAATAGNTWEMPGAGTEAAGVLSLRSPTVLPYHPIVVRVHYSELLSAQVLFDEDVVNTILQASPLLLEYYPFYLADPIGFIRAYLDDLLVAGSIPDYEL